MTDNDIIAQIEFSFVRHNLRDIREINDGERNFTIAEFILCSCLIDQISGFRYNKGKGKVGERYKQFVKDYLPNYNSDALYHDLRNQLVHNYSIGSHYRLIRKSMHLHLENIDDNIYLNLENFISDIGTALNKYFNELRTDADIRQNALFWYKQHKIIGRVS